MDQKKIGEFLKELRTEKKLTQEQLANEFTVSSRTVSRWETGSNLPDIATLVEIADYYEVDVSELIAGERKSDSEKESEEETVNIVAAYAKNENEKLYKWIQRISVLGLLAMTVAIVLQCVDFQVTKLTVGMLIASLVALFALTVITFYVTGNLERLLRKKMFIVKAFSFAFTAISIFVIARFVLIGSVLSMLVLSVITAKVEVHDDIAEYQKYVQQEDSGLKMFSEADINVFPNAISNGMNAKEFQYAYYNPWDPQYVVYMTVQYEDEEYSKEIERLKKIGVDDSYKSFYSVTDEPADYDLVAICADSYHGFVYAMIPEQRTENEITYVAIQFCNYFLDLDIHDYLPDRYLLSGFDATNDNPYQKQKMKEMKME